jgi:glycopeptide antibiotics resistance protein
MRYLSALPFALPAFIVGIVAAALVAKYVGRRVGERPIPVFLWLASLALVLSATLTPSSYAIAMEEGLSTGRVWIWALPSPGALFSVNWQSMNLVLFAPLGFASGLFSARRRVVALSLFAGLVSVVVEIVQYLAIPLGRAQFNSATVLIGWEGIIIGLLVGAVASACLTASDRAGRRRSST